MLPILANEKDGSIYQKMLPIARLILRVYRQLRYDTGQIQIVRLLWREVFEDSVVFDITESSDICETLLVFGDKGGDGGIGSVVEQLAVTPIQVGVGFAERLDAAFDAAAAGGGKRYENFAFEIVRFYEAVDDVRRHVPPNWKSDVYDVVLGYVVAGACQSRARCRVFHFDGSAALVVGPIKVGVCVWLRRGDFENVSMCCLGDALCHGAGGACGGEIRHEDFFVVVVLLHGVGCLMFCLAAGAQRYQ